ncbi:MAG: hypothetical protein J2P48_15500 [Alphaproteobacteria bacterium]|nr:hypothetical protein [Alphaproteobacteria bacterium]
MALVGLSEAAKLSGRNQTTIHRAMKTGRLSYTVGEAGERRIDTAELDRVFGIKANGASDGAVAHPVQSHITPVREIEALQRLLDDREATIRDLREHANANAATGSLTPIERDRCFVWSAVEPTPVFRPLLDVRAEFLPQEAAMAPRRPQLG